MTTKTTTNKSSSMVDLLKSHKTAFVDLTRGQTITGTITKLTPSEILLDINAKSEAVVLEKDKRLLRNLLQTLKVGEKVEATVLNPESDMGNPVVSLRRFNDENLWNKLLELKEKQEPLDVEIKEVTKGGYVAQSNDGISGFLPNSHVAFASSGKNQLGMRIKVFIADLEREDKKVIFTQKNFASSEGFSKAIKTFKVGQKITAVVTNVAPFGVFVSIPVKSADEQLYIDGLIHISEIAWENIENISERFKTGDNIDAVIIGFDSKSKRLELSIKRLSADPFTEKTKNYKVDQKVQAKVKRTTNLGVVFVIGDDVEGFIRKDKIPPTVNYEVGQEISVTISQIDSVKRRMILSPVLTEKPLGYR